MASGPGFSIMHCRIPAVLPAKKQDPNGAKRNHAAAYRVDVPLQFFGFNKTVALATQQNDRRHSHHRAYGKGYDQHDHLRG